MSLSVPFLIYQVSGERLALTERRLATSNPATKACDLRLPLVDLQTIFLPLVGLVDPDKLKPGDLVGVNKDSYLILDTLPSEYDSRVKAMEVDEKPTEAYDDIGGLEKQIQELVEAIVLPMTHQERFQKLGIRPPKGVLLYGPPGTGKTLMARACAAQTNATFLKLAGPQLVQMFIGDGAKLVRDAFQLAKEKSPCIIFIDEIDAIGTKRFDSEVSGDREVQRTMLELLNQLDGFSSDDRIKLMILVDDAGGEWPMIGHAPWNGCNLADFVMPFFLFIVGMAIALALKRIPNWLIATRKVILRTLKLLFWGLLLQGGYSHAPDKLTYGVDMKKIRWCGILQRIALAYLVVALIEILTKDAQAKDLSRVRFSIFRLYCWHWLVGACVLIVYLAVIYGIYVPDWHFTVHNTDSADYGKILTVTCGVRGKLDPPCNAVGYIDREVLGINHMYEHPAWKRSKACTKNSPYEGPFLNDAPSWCWAPFEPEGILSSISAILSTIIGVHYGHVLIHMKSHSSRLIRWIVMGLALLLLGITLHFTNAIPLNKQLYTFSYVCVTSGAAALVFSAFYTLVDIWNLKYLFLPLEWIGMNAMLVYVMAAEGIFAAFINGWYYGDSHNTLIYWIQKHIFIGVWHSRRVGVLLYVVFAEILFWGVVAGILHGLRIYWKL